MKGAEPALLMGVERPSLAAIEEGAEDNRLVYLHLGVYCKHVVFPHSLGQSGHLSCCFPNSGGQFGVKREIASDC